MNNSMIVAVVDFVVVAFVDLDDNYCDLVIADLNAVLVANLDDYSLCLLRIIHPEQNFNINFIN